MTSKILIKIIVILFSFLPCALAKKVEKNSLTAYYSVGTNAHIEEIPTFSFEKRNAYFAGITYGQEFYRTQKFKELSLEYEIGAYEHFGDFGSHQESTVAVLSRFSDLFAQNFLIESFAMGWGLSLATEDPKFEAYLHEQNQANDFLNYLAFELVFKLPKLKNTKFVYRLHHRSGVYGLFDGINGGSNYLAFGLRHKF